MTRTSQILLTLLRIAVGWHFLYEGLWKIDSDTGATAYATSWYPLQSSLARVDDSDKWYDDVVKTFKGRNEALSEDQKGRLAELRDKTKIAGRAEFDWAYVKEYLQIAAPPEGERFTSLPFLQQSNLRWIVRDMDGLDRLTLTSAHAALDRRSAQIADHYAFTPDQRARLAAARDTVKQAFATAWSAPDLQARLADYKLMRRRTASLSDSALPFHHERLLADRQKLDAIAADLLAFVNEPADELAVQGQSIASVAQLGRGPIPRPTAPTDWIDRVMKYGLVAIGACLLLGIFTRWAAIAAALQLLTFYIACPPFPGLPGASTGGHYLYIDRNFIEMIAAATIAAMAGGRHESQRATTQDRAGQLSGRPEADAA